MDRKKRQSLVVLKVTSNKINQRPQNIEASAEGLMTKKGYLAMNRVRLPNLP